MSLFDLLDRVFEELPGCQLTSIVSLDSGLPLASVTPRLEDAAGADAFQADLYRQAGRAMAELGSGQKIENVVLESRQSIYVSFPLEDSGYFWHVVTDRRTTLGFTQAVMRKYSSEIVSSMRELLEV